MLHRTIINSLVAISSLSIWLAGCNLPDESETDRGSTTGDGGGETTTGDGGGETTTGDGGGETTTGGGQTGGTSTSSSSSTDSGSTGSTTSTDTGGTTSVVNCTEACQSAADCASDSGAYSSDNWACNGGACIYKGCKSDAECAASVCVNDPAYPYTYCAAACQSAADCASDSGAYSSDNWACSGGGCVYKGCKLDSECATTYSSAGYVCTNDPALPYAYCAVACQSAADCASDSGAYSSDNWACNGGGCTYKGCKSDSECATTYGSAGFVCGGI